MIFNDKILQTAINGLEAQLKLLNERIDKFEEIKEMMDEGIVLMKKQELLDMVRNEMDDYESNIDDKLTGFYTTVEEAIAKRNGGGKELVGMMKKIARLEAVKDSTEHRRATKDLIELREVLKKKALDINRAEGKADDVMKQIAILNWVLGEDVAI